MMIFFFLEFIIDSVLHDVVSSIVPEGSGYNEEREFSEITTHLQEQDTRVCQTDTTEGESTEGEEKAKSFWLTKKFWILTISFTSLLFIALILGLSLYFGLYSGKHNTTGDFFENNS